MMGVHIIRVPDIGEGIAETEIAEWLVAPGDLVAEDQPLAAVMTDKATVEIPSPVAGRVIACAADTGDTIAVGAELIRLEVVGAGNLGDAPPAEVAPVGAVPPPPHTPAPPSAQPETNVQSTPAASPADASLAAPSVRALARDLGIDLRQVRGTGPQGRILREDVEGFAGPQPANRGLIATNSAVEEVRIIGLRKRIAARMEEANRIPHITIVEEIDANALETLRQKLNERPKNAIKLTLLPFLARAIVRAVAEQPVMNAHHDAAAGILRQFGGVHLGVATQTPSGLVVPVLRHAESYGLTGTAAEIARLAEAAREGRATREELSGSTITISSLGPVGAIATTPILNAPEVAIVGVNRLAIRPFWNGTAFEPRKMMNLSCSFDHRVVDGWDAAMFVQHLKTLLEMHALLFVEP
jgi:2-oxoisovalerate dehydrogenase E2 component (dihydrolipoyl transacylase)